MEMWGFVAPGLRPSASRTCLLKMIPARVRDNGWANGRAKVREDKLIETKSNRMRTRMMSWTLEHVADLPAVRSRYAFSPSLFPDYYLVPSPTSRGGSDA